MINRSRFFFPVTFLVLFVISFLSLSPIVHAMETQVDLSVKVYDYADLLSDSEELELADQANAFAENYSSDLAIVTIDDAEGRSSAEYAGDFYDTNGFGAGTDYTGLLLLINMNIREVWISTTGDSMRIFTDTTIRSMVDGITSDLANGDYYSGCLAFVRDASDYQEQNTLTPDSQPESAEDVLGGITPDTTVPETLPPQSTQSPPDITDTLFKTLLISIGISGIAVGVMAAMHNQKTRNAENANAYQYNHSFDLTNKSDRYLRSNVTKQKIPKDNDTGSSFSGSSTHTSSSGRSHGGGGGRF